MRTLCPPVFVLPVLSAGNASPTCPAALVAQLTGCLHGRLAWVMLPTSKGTSLREPGVPSLVPEAFWVESVLVHPAELGKCLLY